MLVLTPRMRNSRRARSMRWQAIVEIAPPRRDLHQQRIVERRDHRAAVCRAAVQPDAEARRRAVGVDPAVVGDEVVGRIFGGDAALQGVAVERDLLLRRQIHLRPVQAQSLGDLDLGAHQVDAGDHFGDRVLHLDARVHLDEEPLAGFDIDQELDGAGVVVAGGARQLDGGLGQGRADRRDRATPRARPRRPSGGAAAPSSRARRGAGCCRGGRPGSAPRCAWRGGCSAPGRPRRCRTRRPLRAAPRRVCRRTPRACPPRACRVRRRRTPP